MHKAMKISTITNFLFFFYFVSTIVFGFILIAFGDIDSYLRLKDWSRPFFLLVLLMGGQLTLVIQYRNSINKRKKNEVIESSWLIFILPTILYILIIIGSFVWRGEGIRSDWPYQLSEVRFNMIILFAATILNISTIDITRKIL